MNDAEVVAQVRGILDARRPAEETIRQIKQLVRPPVEPTPVQLTDRGWPVLQTSMVPPPAPSTVWRRHDDPEWDR